MKYFVKIYDFKSRIKKMQKLYNKNKTETVVKNIIENLIYLNCNLLTVLVNILELINNLKFVTDFANFFNYICKNINIIYQLTSQFLLSYCEEEN